MTSQRWPLLIGLLVLVFSVYWLKQKEQTLNKVTTAPENKSTPLTQSYARGSSDPASPISKSRPLHLQNIQQMTQILKTAATQSSLQETLDRLQKLKMEPSLFQDSSVSAGTLSVVRTEKPLRGTRYFHAQYFSGDNQKPFLQHMSFEIPPGKDSFRTAAQTIKDTFGSLPPANMQTPNMIAWTWKGKYTVWAMKMDKDSLISDAFNAYTPQDVGTVRIAVELDIHNHGDHL